LVEFLDFCVTKLCLASQENRFNVLPRVCRTLFTQIPIAAFSFVEFLRVFTVLRTFLIQSQNLLEMERAILLIYLTEEEENGYQPFNSYKG
jgi:hypothetical protein